MLPPRRGPSLLFAVERIAYLAVVLRQCRQFVDCGGGERNALVSRTEDDIELEAV